MAHPAPRSRPATPDIQKDPAAAASSPASVFGQVLYGRRFDDGSPLLASPFSPDGTVEVTAVLGGPGSGKSYWLANHATRLAAAGVPLIVIDPFGDLRDAIGALGAREVVLGSGSHHHINPFRRSPDNGGADLRPVFEILLGSDFNEDAESVLGAATAAFYADPQGEERILGDFIATLRDLPLAPPLHGTRDHLVAVLEQLAQGELADLFAHRTDVGLEPVRDRP
jgi:hypothetical protein